MLSRENIIAFNNNELPEFPERFDNEIYLSRGKTIENNHAVNYLSNFSLKYVFEGEENYVVEGKRQSIKENKILIINNGSNASFTGSDANAVSIFINPDILQDCQKPLLDKRGFLESPLNNPHAQLSFFDSVQHLEHFGLRILLERIANNPQLILTQDFYYELATQIILSQNATQRRINKIGSVKQATRRELYKRLEMAKDYMNDNLKRPFDLDKISRISCISKYHFIRIFKEVYGTTPHRYHLKNKIALIENLLSKDVESKCLKDISNDFGFSNYSVFYKQFKLINGKAPSGFIHEHSY
ncbi:helix-turn-helix transcriptional regulator [Muricauda sp. NFXS6]|uniref:helix-turn-helix domain-containing protein n=1 Tax=Allomuricauda sp. NFXS6 TaxID=2819094 RepID=UPI0032DE50A1